MKTRSLVLCSLFGCSLALPVFLANALAKDDSLPQDTNREGWMGKKLEYSQGILAGLVYADFERVKKFGKQMDHVSEMEQSFLAQTDEYRTQLEAFRNANDQLLKRADEHNVDGVSLAYMQLTMSCVNCHRILRDQGK